MSGLGAAIAGSSSIGVAIVRNVTELRVASADSGYIVQSIAPGPHINPNVCSRIGFDMFSAQK